MSKDLVRLANRLDSLGLIREANLVDALLKKKASDEMGDEMSEELRTLKSFISGIARSTDAARAFSNPDPLFDGKSGKELLASLHRAAEKAGVTPDEAMNMLSEELASFKSNKSESEESESEMVTFDEPPIDYEALKKAYERYTEAMLHVNSVEVTSLYWNPNEGNYVITAEGFWNDSEDKYTTKEGLTIWEVHPYYGKYGMNIKDRNGNTHYFVGNF
jgi:hypothetical protein